MYIINVVLFSPSFFVVSLVSEKETIHMLEMLFSLFLLMMMCGRRKGRERERERGVEGERRGKYDVVVVGH